MVSNFNSKVPQGGIYPHIKFERDRLNIFRVRVFMSSGSMGGHGGGDAKTIISANTSFGDIIKSLFAPIWVYLILFFPNIPIFAHICLFFTYI